MASSDPQPGQPTAAAPAPPPWRIRQQAIASFVPIAAFVLGLPVLVGWGQGVLVVGLLVAAGLAAASAWALPAPRATDTLRRTQR